MAIPGGRREVNQISALQAQITELQQRVNNVPGQSQGLRGYVPVNQNGHGFSVGEAVGYTGSTWVAAVHANVPDYTLRGYVVAVTDSNNFVTMVGVGYVGTIPEISGGSTWQTYWLNTSTAGQLDNTQGSSDYAWLQVLEETHTATLCDLALASGISSFSSIVEYTETAHGFSVDDAVGYISGSGWEKADVDNAESYDIRGVVTSVTNANQFKACIEGFFESNSSMYRYLSDTSPGAMTNTRNGQEVPWLGSGGSLSQHIVLPTIYIDTPDDDPVISRGGSEAYITMLGDSSIETGTIVIYVTEPIDAGKVEAGQDVTACSIFRYWLTRNDGSGDRVLKYIGIADKVAVETGITTSSTTDSHNHTTAYTMPIPQGSAVKGSLTLTGSAQDTDMTATVSHDGTDYAVEVTAKYSAQYIVFGLSLVSGASAPNDDGGYVYTDGRPIRGSD